MTFYTRPQTSQPPPTRGVCPTLVFQKWHAYDGPSLETKESRSNYLGKVVKAVKDVAGSSMYRNWYADYDRALTALGVERVGARTLGRLVAGMATNPALETGLHLHHLLGVPYLAGSAIKGLIHHAAEMELSEVPGLADDSILEDSGELEKLLRRVESIWRIFGSLTVEPAREVRKGEQQRLGPETVRSKLSAWRRKGRIPERFRERVDRLLDRHTGGRLACYDAMPAPGKTDLLELDVLNPHYPLYYRSEGEEVPSDDQDPVPVVFLVVRPGVRFVFPWRLRDRTGTEEASRQEESDEELVAKWFGDGLEGWGAGGKTAAGYGYFELEDRKEGPAAGAGAETEAVKGDSTPDQQPVVWRRARLMWVPHKELLEAKHGGKTAHTREQELLDQLPADARERLTRKKNRKTLLCDVEVVQQSREWFDLVGIRYPRK